MALDEPRFKQSTTAIGPDTSAAELIESAARIGVTAVKKVSTGKLREEVGAQRDQFLELQSAIADDEGKDIRLAPSEGGDLITLDINNVLSGSVNDQTITANVRELAAMDAEIQAANRAVQQGIQPTRALEMNVENITRRYIDRFPGLAAEFQSVAQQALGTENNLMTATMRHANELSRARETAAAANNPFEAAFDAGFEGAINGATQEERVQSVARHQANLRFQQRLDALKQEEEFAVAMGLPGRAQRRVNQQASALAARVTSDISGTLAKFMPPDMQANGLAGVASFIANVQDGDIEDTLLALEVQRVEHVLAIQGQFAGNVNMTDFAQSKQDELVTAVNDLYGTLGDSISGKTLLEATDTSLKLLQNFHGIQFEQLFGAHHLIYKNILQFIPVDSRLQNLEFRNIMEQDMIELFVDSYGTGSMRSVFANTEGIDEESVAGRMAIDLTNKSMIASFGEFLDVDREAVSTAYPHARIMTGFSEEFRGMAPEDKMGMLNLLGTDKWSDYWAEAQQDPKLALAALDLKNRIETWGGIQINLAVEQLGRDITTSAMTQKFGIFKLSDLTDKETGELIRIPIVTGDLVTIRTNESGISFIPKSPSEIEAAGLDSSEENMRKVQHVTSLLNTQLATGLNAYARGLGNIGEGNSRGQILEQVLQRIAGNATTEQ